MSKTVYLTRAETNWHMVSSSLQSTKCQLTVVSWWCVRSGWQL